MNFQRHGHADDESGLNLIPLIDVLLVIVIFLAATTSFAQFTKLPVRLPEASAQPAEKTQLIIAVSQDGHYALNGVLLDEGTPAAIASALKQAMAGQAAPTLTIYADGQATHQSVVNIMEAARMAGISNLNFAAQTAP